MSAAKNPLYEFGPYCIEIETGKLWRSDQAVSLRPTERKLLLVLVKESIQAGGIIIEPMDPRDLIRKVWGRADAVEIGTVHQTASRLRSAIGDSEKNIIETVHNEGYRLIVPVTARVLSETVT